MAHSLPARLPGSGAAKKQLGIEVISEKKGEDGERRYDVAPLRA